MPKWLVVKWSDSWQKIILKNPVEIQKFDRLGYSFRSDLSSDTEYVFERKIEK